MFTFPPKLTINSIDAVPLTKEYMNALLMNGWDDEINLDMSLASGSRQTAVNIPCLHMYCQSFGIQ